MSISFKYILRRFIYLLGFSFDVEVVLSLSSNYMLKISEIVALYEKSLTETFSRVDSILSISLFIYFTIEYILLFKFVTLLETFNKKPLEINLNYSRMSDILKVFCSSNFSLAEI